MYIGSDFALSNQTVQGFAPFGAAGTASMNCYTSDDPTQSRPTCSRSTR